MDQAQGYVLLTLKVWKEDNQYVAHCEELGTASCGDSVEEAFANIRDAVFMHLNALEETGERQRFFAEHKITVQRGLPKVDRKTISVGVDEFVTRELVPA